MLVDDAVEQEVWNVGGGIAFPESGQPKQRVDRRLRVSLHHRKVLDYQR